MNDLAQFGMPGDTVFLILDLTELDATRATFEHFDGETVLMLERKRWEDAGRPNRLTFPITMRIDRLPDLA